MNTPKSYASSGLPTQWDICNAGDGVVGLDDDCQTISSVSIPEEVLGQSPQYSKRLIDLSRQALIDAASQQNLQRIKIGGCELNKDRDPEPLLVRAL